jgi:hypothetical protein
LICAIASASVSTTFTEITGPKNSVARHAEQLPRALVGPQLDPALGQRRADPRQECLGHRAVHQQRFAGVAHAHPLALGVDGHPLGHRQVSRGVHVHVAVAREVLDHGHLGLGRHAPDEALAPPGNRHVDVVGQRQEVPHGVAVGRLHQVQRVGGQSVLGCLLAQQRDNRAARMGRLLPPAKDDRVAALQADGGCVGGHVGPRLVDEEHDAQRHADLLHFQAVGPNRGLNDLAHRVSQGGDFLQPDGNLVNPLGCEPQAIDLRIGKSVLRRKFEVLGIGRQQPLGRPAQGLGRRPEPGVFLLAPRDSQLLASCFGFAGRLQAVGG